MSVVIPTIGRPALLRACLESILGASPSPSDVVVADQSDGEVAAVIAELGCERVRAVPCLPRGIGRARNCGLRAAMFDVVAFTDDDCVVDSSWLGHAWLLASRYPGELITGQVKASSDGYVPSTQSRATRQVWSGRAVGVLYSGNMVANRRDLFAIGGFDERDGLLRSEDVDLGYRWLRDGRRLRYEPALVVTHHAWRTPSELQDTNRMYAFGQGVFIAKHLMAGDLYMLKLLVATLASGIVATVVGKVTGQPRWSDPRRELVPHVVTGVIAGVRERRGRASDDRVPDV
jgi:glycosyltransferase involved in cell wall biosynthesis